MNKENENFSNVKLNWYPGHMAKTRRQIESDLKLIDVVVELLDARIPVASRNPDIKNLTKNKKRIILLNKCDLADEKINQKWVDFLSKEAPTILTDSKTGKGIEKVTRKIEELMQAEIEKQASRGRINKTIRVMILGIPNVGKSSFINRISKKTTMEVGNKPGVTKAKQWIRIGKNQELLDTPGVLWPKLGDEKVALNLAYTETIKDDVLETIEVGFSLLKFLLKNNLNELIERYKLETEDVKQILDDSNLEENEKSLEILHKIGRKRGAVISGGDIDEEKTAKIILDDFRSGKIGKITLEKA